MLPSSTLICSLAKATPLSTFTVSPSLFWFSGGGKKLNSDSKAVEALQFLLAHNYLEMGMRIGSSDSSKVMFLDPRSIPATLDGMRSIVSEETNGKMETLL